MIIIIQRFFILFISTLLFFSCQKNEIVGKIVFDNSLLEVIHINAIKKEIKIVYQTSLNDPFIEHVMLQSPTQRATSWLNDNIINFGSRNILEIKIQNASIKRSEFQRDIKIAGVMKKQNEYLYELNYDVEFFLYNDNEELLANTIVKVFRSTTSGKFISLNERDRILDSLTADSLEDLSKKSFELLKEHMSEYML